MKKKLVHYIEIFLVSFAVTLLFNADHILAARGLSAVKSLALAALIAAAKAGLDAVRAAAPTKA